MVEFVGYDEATGVMTAEDVDDLEDLNDAILDTTGRYLPAGVYHIGDRAYPDDPNVYYQGIERKPFKKGAVRLGPGTTRECHANEEEVYSGHHKYCLTPCPEDSRRNERTNRCYKRDAVRRRRFQCRSGYIRNPRTKRCRRYVPQPNGEAGDQQDGEDQIPELEDIQDLENLGVVHIGDGLFDGDQQIGEDQIPELGNIQDAILENLGDGLFDANDGEAGNQQNGEDQIPEFGNIPDALENFGHVGDGLFDGNQQNDGFDFDEMLDVLEDPLF